MSHKFSLLTLLLILLLSASAFAQNSHRLVRGSMGIVGTSTLHGWKADCKNVNCGVSIASGTVNVTSLNLVQQVKSIKSSEGSLMDKYMYEAMKADQHATIAFQLTQCSVTGATSDGSDLLVKGNLTIAGVTKAIEMKVSGHKLANGEIRYDGAKPIKMSEYGIKPPVVMGMKVGDEVTIKWDLVFAPN